MKKQMTFILTVLCCLGMTTPHAAQAEEIEVLRGEETETEVFLEGSEEVYALFGDLESTADFVKLKSPEEENGMDYQALELKESGSSARLLLSNRGDYGYGLWLRLRVEGVRIGTGSVSLAETQMTDKNGEWLYGVKLPELAVKVLPNPLIVNLSGIQGNNGWYTSTVEVSIIDKDAAEIWYDTGSGKAVYTGPFTVYDGSTTLTVTSDDGYGYKKEETRWISVDTVKPSVTVSLREMDWQQEIIEVTAKSTDGTSGIADAFWSFSESKEEDSSGSRLDGEEVLVMEEDGSWYLHLWAEDKAGNETRAVYGPYRKDSVAPEICFENLHQGKLVEEGILPEIEVTDSCSGIKKIAYTLDGQEWSPAEITGKGKHSLVVTAEDLAGNTRTETIEFFIYDRIEVTASAGDTHYTGTASFSALVTYRGEPLPDAEAEFFVNGESLGVKHTDREGKAWMHLPMELSPQEAEFTVKVSQDEERFLLAGEDTDTFTVRPEKAWLLYGGSYSVWKGEPLYIYLETGELPDFRMGDITRAELLVELYRIENDGSKTYVEEVCLTPDEWGVATHAFYPDTGLYELKISFTEDSCYTGQEILLHPAVFNIEAELDWDGGSLLLDLPHLGVYMNLGFTFLPPTIEAEVEVRIPGTGITLTENKITGYDLTTDGIVLYGTAVNPADGAVYSYEVKTGYTMGFLLDELETSIWKGEDRTKEPVYHFAWSAEDGIAE